MGKRIRKSSDAWGASKPKRQERDDRTRRYDDRSRPDPAVLEARILRQLEKDPAGGTAYMLSQAMGLDGRDVGQAIRRMVEQGKVLEVRPGRYQASGSGGEFAATLEDEKLPGGGVRLLARLPDGSHPVVNPRFTLGAGTGDVVQVTLGEDGLALVTRILRRNGREVVGTIQFKGPNAFLVCDNRREGLVRILTAYDGWDDDYQVGNRYIGTIETTGEGEAGVALTRKVPLQSPEIADFSYVCLQHDLPGEFPEEVEAQAKAYPKTFTIGRGKQKREDLREKLVFTIDPATAKDFDDAISLEHDEQGRWVLGVHIADVSHFVTENTPLDAEAVNRGTSVYLVNRVIPMLPEVLSNGLCSLVPHQPRYCLSAFLTIDRRGTLVGTRLAETLIESRHRFTYEEAMDVLVDKDPTGKWPADVRAAVKETGGLAQVLRRNREKAGALNLFSVEHRFKLDVNGIPIEVTGEVSDESHQLIEECMLLANRAVAHWIQQQGLPCVYRLHEAPDEERLNQFAAILEVYGKDASRIQNRFGLGKLIQDLAKEPPAARKVLNYLLLRCFKKATYGVDNVGHHALAFEHYAHFTSPIRRYPDLLVHRLVKRALGLKDYKTVEIRKGYLDALAKQSTFLEQRAEMAERDLHARKAARYLAARIGEEFPAVVVSAFPGGLQVQLLETGMDGVLPVRELKDDYYEFDPKALCLVGRHSGRKLGPGAEVDVMVAHVDIERADISFGLDPAKKASAVIREVKRVAKARQEAVVADSEPVEAGPAAALVAALEDRAPTTRTTAKGGTVPSRAAPTTAPGNQRAVSPASARQQPPAAPTTGRTTAPAQPTRSTTAVPATTIAPAAPAAPATKGRSPAQATRGPAPVSTPVPVTPPTAPAPVVEPRSGNAVTARPGSGRRPTRATPVETDEAPPAIPPIERSAGDLSRLLQEADRHHGKHRPMPIDVGIDRRRLPDQWRRSRDDGTSRPDGERRPASVKSGGEADEGDEWTRVEPRPRKGKRKDKSKKKGKASTAAGPLTTRRHRHDPRTWR